MVGECRLLWLPPGLLQVTLAAKITDRRAVSPSPTIHTRRLTRLKQHVDRHSCPLKQKKKKNEQRVKVKGRVPRRNLQQAELT